MTIRTHTKRINKSRVVLNKYKSTVEAIITKGANDVRNTAVKSINTQSGGGVTYQKYNPDRVHTASAPNTPPNTDTGYLVSNIHVVIDGDKLGASVESRADYSEALEFGTSKMAPRPFMQPALEENRPKIRRMYARLKSRGV